MSMGTMPITTITKPEEPKKKDQAFAFDVFGKGTVKATEVTDNSNASMGFDDLFGGSAKPT